MILPVSYTPAWIQQKRKAYPTSDPVIMEKVIYALSMVEQVVQTGLRYYKSGHFKL
jgi:hypothetical protein